MTITQKIQEIIDEVKLQSNSLERNKIVSHLEDSMAWSIRQQNKVAKALLATEPAPKPDQGGCICPLGAVDKSCPIHGV